MIYDVHELVSQTAPLNIYYKQILEVYNQNFTCTSCFPTRDTSHVHLELLLIIYLLKGGGAGIAQSV